MTINMMTAALDYADRGIRVLPLWGIKNGACACPRGKDCDNLPGKHPNGTLVRNGAAGATTDREKIRDWWVQYPEANIGINPGANVVAIDVDPRNGGNETFANLVEQYGALPRTRTAKSGSLGRHYYVKLTGDARGKLGAGIDVKTSKNQYLIAAPSLHASGHRYEWIDESPIADAPDNWAQAMRKTSTSEQFAAVDAVAIANWQWTPGMRMQFDQVEGSRFELMRAMVGECVGACLTLEETTGVLMTYPPAIAKVMEERGGDADWIAQDTAKNYAAKIEPLRGIGIIEKMLGNEMLAATGQDVIERAEIETVADAEKITKVEALKAELLSRDDLRNLPVAEPLIEGVLMRHSYALLTGRDHTYKTFIALDWALSLAMGMDWNGRPTEQCRVLYMAGEGAYGFNGRIAAWEAHHGVKVDPDMFVVLQRTPNLHKGAEVPALCELISEMEFGLVVVDTLRRATGGADGNGSDMGTVVDNIELIKRATSNGSVLVIAHTGKTDNDARGFSGIEDDADIVWHAVGSPGNSVIENTKMKEGPNGLKVSLFARLIADSVVMIEAVNGAAFEADSKHERAILSVMESMFANGAASRSDLVIASGLDRNVIARVTTSMEKAGKLVQTSSGGTNRYLYTLPQ